MYDDPEHVAALILEVTTPSIKAPAVVPHVARPSSRAPAALVASEAF
jgi:hypothetical protein